MLHQVSPGGDIAGATSQKLVGSLLRNILWQYNAVDFIAIIHDCANMKLSPAVYVRITGIYSSDLHSIWYNEESCIFSYFYFRGNIKVPFFLFYLFIYYSIATQSDRCHKMGLVMFFLLFIVCFNIYITILEKSAVLQP